jgi:hypothetical protein
MKFPYYNINLKKNTEHSEIYPVNSLQGRNFADVIQLL